MDEVKVKRDDLLDILRKNREQHTRIFNEALEGYKAKVIEMLERSLEQARRGERVAESLRIPSPVNQTHEYNRAIKMLEMSVDSEITLGTQEFDMYVMDRWHWKQQFLAANSTYSGTAMMAMASPD